MLAIGNWNGSTGTTIRCMFEALRVYLSFIYKRFSGRSLSVKTLNFMSATVYSDQKNGEICVDFASEGHCFKGKSCNSVHVDLSCCIIKDRFLRMSLIILSLVGVPKQLFPLNEWATAAVLQTLSSASYVLESVPLTVNMWGATRKVSRTVELSMWNFDYVNEFVKKRERLFWILHEIFVFFETHLL